MILVGGMGYVRLILFARRKLGKFIYKHWTLLYNVDFVSVIYIARNVIVSSKHFR